VQRIRLWLLVLLVTYCVAPAPALGQATTTTATTTPATSTSGSTSTGDSHDGTIIAVVILVLGGGAAALAYVFYDGWRRSYERLASDVLATTQAFPDTEFDPVAGATFRSRGISEEAEGTRQPTVTGPTALVVGAPATYKATVEGEPATQTAWEVAPTDSATLDPPTGPQTAVTASKEGALTITAKLGAGEPTVVTATALAPRGRGKVPLLGTSWAGITAVIVAFSIAGALTALGRLDGDAFIAFLGPVVGYFFAAARDGGGAKGAEASGAAAGNSGTEGS
jgi:hypothetical protein